MNNPSILEISNEEYQRIGALSFSSMKEFIKSPAHYQAYLRKERSQTDAQLLGTLVHAAILEPERFESEFKVVEGNRNKKEVKEKIEAYETLGITSIKQKQYDAALYARDAVLNNPSIKEIFNSGVEIIKEKSILVTEELPDSNLLCPLKFRPDIFIPSGGVILDVKTYADLSDRSIERQIRQQSYDLQALHYLHVGGLYLGEKIRLFGNIFVEVEEPYGCRLVGISEASLEYAEQRYSYRSVRNRFAECVKLDEWPNYEPTFEANLL